MGETYRKEIDKMLDGCDEALLKIIYTTLIVLIKKIKVP